MNLSVDNRLDSVTAAGGAERTDRMDRPLDSSGVKQAAQWKSDLGKAIGEIDKLQAAADAQTDAVARGAGNLHEMMLALEKADVAMRLAMRVRNKIIDVYNDIMRMGV